MDRGGLVLSRHGTHVRLPPRDKPAVIHGMGGETDALMTDPLGDGEPFTDGHSRDAYQARCVALIDSWHALSDNAKTPYLGPTGPRRSLDLVAHTCASVIDPRVTGQDGRPTGE